MSEYNVGIAKDDTHVYCTQCAWLIYTDGIPTCKYEKECNIWDAEDSRPLLNRPYYKPIGSSLASEAGGIRNDKRRT